MTPFSDLTVPEIGGAPRCEADGHVAVPNLPGLGIEINTDLLSPPIHRAGTQLRKTTSMTNLRAKFSDHLRSGRPMIGTWLQVAHPTIVEAMAQTGFDFVLVDGEHAPTPPDVLGGVLPSLELHGRPSLYRVRSNTADLIKSVLDHGVSASWCRW